MIDRNLLACLLAVGLAPAWCGAQTAVEEGASSSLLAASIEPDPRPVADGTDHALHKVSMFAVAPPEAVKFREHDLVQIIIRESSSAKSTHELETEKEYDLNGKVSAWPDLSLTDLANLQAFAGRTTGLPELKLKFSKEFTGEGDYKRKDDLTARVTAEVIEILPNGNLVLEARSSVKTDAEETTIRATGVCRPEDVTPANTVLSNQLHDLKIEKVNTGELKKSGEKGIIAKVLDAVFAF